MTALPPYLRVVERQYVVSDRPALPIRDTLGARSEARPEGVPVDMLVLHRGVGPSVHYVVEPDGSVVRMVPEDRRAWHAGVSHWRGVSGVDGRSIGVALSGPEASVLQTAALCDLCLTILARHPIPARNVVALGDVAPERADAVFDWRELAENGVGLWPSDVPDLGVSGGVRDAVRLSPVRGALAEIGYRVSPEGALDPALSAVLRAFQRHWRPEAVTGQADDGTLVRLQAVLRLVRGG